MDIVLFSHPLFSPFQSIHRYSAYLAEGMRARGHSVQTWTPAAYFFRLPFPGALKKWLGYIDQYILFPGFVRRKVKKCDPETLFVFADNALGPWVPLVADRPHIIHCHDFLAQDSALGRIPENRTGWSGKTLQGYIRKGLRMGHNFISVSQNTRQQLHHLLQATPQLSKVVYNGLIGCFEPADQQLSRTLLGKQTGLDLSGGYLLHVGGNQWYKNRLGLIELYNQWRMNSRSVMPLLLVGEAPSPQLQQACNHSPFKQSIVILTQINDELLKRAYTGAEVFIFPSLVEGFGWPIAEAMACGCPVITTADSPMTEVAGKAGFFIPRLLPGRGNLLSWATQAASVLERVVHLDLTERNLAVAAGIKNAQRFIPCKLLDTIEQIYESVY